LVGVPPAVRSTAGARILGAEGRGHEEGAVTLPLDGLDIFLPDIRAELVRV
jgi:hypothetical protein